MSIQGPCLVASLSKDVGVRGRLLRGAATDLVTLSQKRRTSVVALQRFFDLPAIQEGLQLSCGSTVLGQGAAIALKDHGTSSGMVQGLHCEGD